MRDATTLEIDPLRCASDLQMNQLGALRHGSRALSPVRGVQFTNLTTLYGTPEAKQNGCFLWLVTGTKPRLLFAL